MTKASAIEWCALGMAPCWTRGEWLTLWSSLGGVFLAYLVGAAAQRYIDKRRASGAYNFLKETLTASLNAIAHFDTDFRKIGNDAQIGRGFGGLAHASAAVRWAIAYPERFDPVLFLRMLKVEQRIVECGVAGPARFAGDNFRIDASTHLSRLVPQVAADIRFLLDLAEPST